MRYYLDFDRTLFDTDSFIAYVKGRADLSHLAFLQETELSESLNAAAVAGALAFEPGELSRFLYPDAAQFLRDKENAASIITFGKRRLQELKVKSALHGIPRVSAIYTDSLQKGRYLAPHVHLHVDAILVDDSQEELEILAAECPSLLLYEIRREGRAGDGRWPVIRTLAELP